MVVKTETAIKISALKKSEIKLILVGQTPLYYNAMTTKVKQQLLAGGGKKTAAEKREIKHDPENEFRASVYTHDANETLLCFPCGGIKKAMATAALHTDGIKATELRRLITVMGNNASVWGKPLLKMDVVRSADINRTPDIRTRAYLEEWCAEVRISFTTPYFSNRSIVSILANAGMIVGIGDFRQEKGAGNFGMFDVTSEGSKDLQGYVAEIKKNNRQVQIDALANPDIPEGDTSTFELLEFINKERLRRAA